MKGWIEFDWQDDGQGGLVGRCFGAPSIMLRADRYVQRGWDCSYDVWVPRVYGGVDGRVPIIVPTGSVIDGCPRDPAEAADVAEKMLRCWLRFRDAERAASFGRMDRAAQEACWVADVHWAPDLGAVLGCGLSVVGHSFTRDAARFSSFDDRCPACDAEARAYRDAGNHDGPSLW